MSQRPELIYVGDPMCSWCWGMAPVIEDLAKRDDVDLSLLVGGLRPGPNARPLDHRMRNELRHHWERVADVTGQPFNDAALERSDWVYDTELPAIAVTTLRRHSPEHALSFFTDLQRAFYSDGVDITDHSQYESLIASYPVNVGAYLEELSSEEARTLAWQEFGEVRDNGVAGFPTVLLRYDGTTQVLTRGYTSAERFDDLLAYWVEGVQPRSADVGTCSIDGSC